MRSKILIFNQHLFALFRHFTLKIYRLNGSYSVLKGGSASEAMEDFTGGVSELIELHEPPKHFFDLVFKSIKQKSLMSCAIEVSLHLIGHLMLLL